MPAMSFPHSKWMIATVAALFAGCAKGEQVAQEQTVQGGCQAVFEANICTWATMAGDQVVEFGATIPEALAANAPLEAEPVFPPLILASIPFPAQAVSATGFTHLSVSWESHGHPPALFLTPHFDFHFYTISPDAVQAIDCSDLTKPAQTPAGYTLPDLDIPDMGTLVGICVPKMGMHAMLESELNQTEPFGASMIVGYYQQKLIFLEPMIARAKLMDGQSFPLDVPAVPDAGPGVRWPTHFEAVYDGAAQAYRFVFSGLPAD